MDSETTEWIEIIVWFALPIIFLGAIAGYEYVSGNLLVAAIFAILFIAVVARRIIITRKEVEPIFDAEMQLEKGKGETKEQDAPKEASGPQ
ncbi:MAG: hypothetical protein KGH54_03105 [Candidatus Micrarchaeota archaeon]|nr:hypothetical protein [Candidatus Micrarchaeota archaeon]